VLVRALLRSRARREIGEDAVELAPGRTATPMVFRKYSSPPSPDLITRELARNGGDYRLAASRLGYSVNHLRVLHKRGLAAG
jgi:hypothetical protein